MDTSYWDRQEAGTPLFPDVEWNKPEQRTRAGKLAIIGGNKLGFASVAMAYDEASQLGAGQIRVVVPDALKKTIPPSVTDAVFVATNPSGGMSKDNFSTLQATLAWADHTLLIGDTGRNSETAIMFESLLAQPASMTITRDAVDLLKNASQQLVDRECTTLVVSFAQLQKLFQAVYYPKILSFSMQLTQLVETVHKFTMTYPCTIVTFHQDQLIIAHDGQVVTQAFQEPMMIWRGSTATRAATYQLWTPSSPLQAIAASIS